MATLQAPSWASMPMPAGWEAKYDSNVGKYFFINHTTRSTQWNDPRQQIYDSQRRSPSPSRPQHIPMQPITKPKCKTCKINEVLVPSAGQTCQSCRLSEQQRRFELMRAREAQEEMKGRQEHHYKLEKEGERQRVQSTNRHDERPSGVQETEFTSLSVMEKVTLTNDLKEQFQSTEATVVDMILESCQWDKQKAADTLVTMGEKRTLPGAALTNTEKNQMKARLKKVYPAATEAMIQMALDTTKYNEQKAKQVLNMLKESERPAISGAAVEVTFPETSTSTTITTPRASPAPSSVSPAGSSGSIQMKIPQEKGKRSQQLLTHTGSPSKKTPVNVIKINVRNPTVPAPSRKTMMTAKKGPAKAPTKARKAAAAAPSTASAHASLYSSMAVGPNPSLPRGPDRQNLLDDYVTMTGANGEIMKGPDPHNVNGPCEVTGRDPNMATGSDPSNRCGAEAGLAKGSMYQGITQCLCGW